MADGPGIARRSGRRIGGGAGGISIAFGRLAAGTSARAGGAAPTARGAGAQPGARRREPGTVWPGQPGVDRITTKDRVADVRALGTHRGTEGTRSSALRPQRRANNRAVAREGVDHRTDGAAASVGCNAAWIGRKN